MDKELHILVLLSVFRVEGELDENKSQRWDPRWPEGNSQILIQIE